MDVRLVLRQGLQYALAKNGIMDDNLESPRLGPLFPLADGSHSMIVASLRMFAGAVARLHAPGALYGRAV